jgi:hypothetical protein
LRDMYSRPWWWASLSVGAPIGNLEGGSFTGDFERQVEEGSGNGASVSVGLWDVNLEAGSFSGNFERYVKIALETEHLTKVFNIVM